MNPLLEYQARLDQLDSALAGARSGHAWALMWLAVSLVMVAALAWMAMERRIPVWNALVSFPLAAVTVRRYAGNRGERLQLSRRRSFYERGCERIEGRWAGKGFSGTEFEVPGHPYARDLNLFGTGSIFELLCTARTSMGRERLAGYLLDASDTDESFARQEAVRELSGQTGLREKIALLANYDFRDAAGEPFAEWLDGQAVPVNTWVRVVAFTNSAVLAGLALYAYLIMPLTAGSWLRVSPGLAALVAVNTGVAMFYRKRAREPLAAASRVGFEVGILREGVELLHAQQFASGKLQSIQREAGPIHAGLRLRRLERLTVALRDCDKEGLSLFASILAARTQLWFAIERWRLDYGDALKGWIRAWGEFEAISALAGYAHEHPEDCYPQFASGESLLDMQGAAHPLLPATLEVRNDFTLDEEQRFYVISGSNMAGKSTLLRSVGLNVVLAFAGAPVRSLSMRVSRLAVFASIGVQDSLAEGKSKFLAEIEKLKEIVEAARAGAPVLFLIDEILAGTNSIDRRIVTETCVRGLVKDGAMGALSTHDLTLTEVAEIEGLGGANVHMGSRPGSGPMDFDYRVKAGVIRESNALAIARMAGVA